MSLEISGMQDLQTADLLVDGNGKIWRVFDFDYEPDFVSIYGNDRDNDKRVVSIERIKKEFKRFKPVVLKGNN